MTTTSTVADLRTGLADALGVISGCQVSAYVLSNFTPPALMIRPATDPAVEYAQTMQEGSQNWYFLIVGYVGAVTDIGAQQQLDRWLDVTGSTSVVQALIADRTLGGVCDTLHIDSCRAYQEYARPDGSTVLGAEWTVLVVT